MKMTLRALLGATALLTLTGMASAETTMLRQLSSLHE